MSEVWIREATSEDALFALEKSIFAKEHNAQTAMITYMSNSEKVYAGLIDGEIVCIWGVMRQSLLSGRGYLWLIVTEAAESHKFLLVRYSQRIIERLFDRYTVLIGECSVNDARAKKWMRLLGATFSHPEGGLVPFQIVRSNG